MSGAGQVYGSAHDIVTNSHGTQEPLSRVVEVPPNALAFVSEGFCPACQRTRLNESRRCPSCGIFWHIRRDEPAQ